ncbi:MAG TPA: glycosyltransferase [Solirubrobacterales bacterium]|jgi:GT2 family glycosyltransferase/peptidoglycan/xylan/chitin deacetylase (PgdA/CDA1 family)|nr:glycosyltransferase [Solirubrobacterales bacterium]
MEPRPDISVIVVTHNGREMALRTLRSAMAAAGSASLEWLVVDAGSTDGSAEAIERELPEVRVLRRDNGGFAASNNVGLGLTRGRYVLLLNPDVEILTGTLGDLVAAMDARPELALASVIQRGTDGELQASIRRFPSPLRSLGEALFAAHWPVLRTLQELEARDERYKHEGPADWLVGAFLIARREAVEAVGPLDKRFFLYSEEIDWCYRFWQAGRSVGHLPVIAVTHHGGGRSRGDLMAQLSHSRRLFAAKHYGPARQLGIGAALALGHAIRIAVFGAITVARPQQRARVRAEWAGLRVILGLSPPPLDPDAKATVAADHDERHYLEERYRGESRRSPALSAYYAVKPLLPRRLQLAMRRLYARRQARTEFPRWPIEPLLVERRRGDERAATSADWPDGRRFAAILTHDVEGPAGVAMVEEVIELERRHGFVSSWNFVAEGYPIEEALLDRVRDAGCEVGLHGIKHDCKLFESRASFEAELPAIHRYLARWNAVGFRSPATHRNPDWMPELGALYDSSFPDTDPFEPQAGGCCSIFPYFLGDLVELPITLVQDHTLWEILRRDTIDLWTRKSDWIVANGGLVNLITHPDYLDSPARLRMYEEFLEYLAAQEDGWFPLPRDVATWWRKREVRWPTAAS